MTFMKEFNDRRPGKLGSINSLLFRFENNKNNPQIKLICFVEGYTDSKFYQGVLCSQHRIHSEEIYFLYNNSNDATKNGMRQLLGKKSVISICNYLVNQSEQQLYKCKFIVDKDYDELDENTYVMSDSARPMVTVLPCYSFENYYFYAKNLDVVFKRIFSSLDYSYRDSFDLIVDEYLHKICEYSAWKKLIVKYFIYRDDRVQTRTLIEDNFEEYLLRYSIYRDKLCIDEKFIIGVKNALNNLLSSYNSHDREKIEISYKCFREEIKNNPLEVKGKLLFHLLLVYINYHMKEQFDRKQYTPEDLYLLSIDFDCPGL